MPGALKDFFVFCPVHLARMQEQEAGFLGLWKEKKLFFHWGNEIIIYLGDGNARCIIQTILNTH